MTKELEDRGAYLAVLFATRKIENPAVISRSVARLRSAARALERLAVAACNYGLTPRQEARRERLAEQVRGIANFYGYRVETSGDPRGAVVKLFDPSNDKAGDGFGGGWAVY